MRTARRVRLVVVQGAAAEHAVDLVQECPVPLSPYQEHVARLRGRGQRLGARRLVPVRLDAVNRVAAQHVALVLVDDRHASRAALLLDMDHHPPGIQVGRLLDALFDRQRRAAQALHVDDIGHANLCRHLTRSAFASHFLLPPTPKP